MKPIPVFCLAALIATVAGCTNTFHDDWVEGGLYSILPGPDEPYTVAKILAMDGGCVHVRVYSNRYRLAPTEVDESTLYIAELSDEGEAVGAEHFPLRPDMFAAWQPRYIKTVEVRFEELEEYDDWALRGGECL